MKYLILIAFSFTLYAQDPKLELVKFDEKQLNQLREKTIKLHQSMVECTPYEFDVGHPIMPAAKRFKSTVVGLQDDKTCKFLQTLPHGETKTCLFTEAHRKQIKAEGQVAFNRFMTDPEICKSSQAKALTETKPVQAPIKISFGSPDMNKKDIISDQFKSKEAEVLADYSKLIKKRDELNARKVRIDCSDVGECKTQKYGHKICGGPIGSFVYSTRDPDYSALIKEVDDFTMMDVELQRKSSAASTCDVYEAPEPQCKEGICE